jgi:hypothetical protein
MSDQSSDYSLRFTLTPAQQDSLIIGLLELLKGGVTINSFQASSSLPDRQYDGSWTRLGGLLPPGDSYTVDVDPLWMPNIRGVEGSFYRICPFEVPTKGATRGDFGVHFDANQPGSLGCIVLVTQKGWDAFRREMKKLGQVDRLPLVVKYL